MHARWQVQSCIKIFGGSSFTLWSTCYCCCCCWPKLHLFQAVVAVPFHCLGVVVLLYYTIVILSFFFFCARFCNQIQLCEQCHIKKRDSEKFTARSKFFFSKAFLETVQKGDTFISYRLRKLLDHAKKSLEICLNARLANQKEVMKTAISSGKMTNSALGAMMQEHSPGKKPWFQCPFKCRSIST